MAELTAKQQRFCDEYLIDLNATQAAIRAGYSEKTAYSIGTENLRKPEIKKYIDKRMADIEKGLVADQEEVMRYLSAVMRREKKECVVVTLKKETSKFVPDAEGKLRKQTVKEEVPKIVEIPARLCDANKAAEMLAKRYGLLKDSVSLEVTPVVLKDDVSESD